MRHGLLAFVSLMLVAGCGGGGKRCCDAKGACPTSAVATLQPTQGNQAKGVVHFTQQGADAVHVVGDLEGLKPNAKHAFHIHEFGDVSAPDGASAGGHFNPDGHQHGGPGAAQHHAGDLGNAQTDGQGKAHVDMVLHGVSVCGANAVLGRSVVVHDKEDDLASQPAGNAGARIAVGVIGVGK